MNLSPDRARWACHGLAVRARRRLSGNDGGFVLLESIIAISLITVIMAAIGAEYVGTVASAARQRSSQSASQVANSALEQVRALRPSDLIAGRGATSVSTQFATGNAIPTVAPWLQQMDQASDATATATAGANATIPTCDPTPQGTAGPSQCTQKPGTTAFTVSQFIGTCWLVSAGTSSNCVAASQKTPSSVSYLRVVVSVSWTGSTCGTGCYYVTSTLINASADPTFKANQPPTAAPVINAPGNQTNDIGDNVNLQLGLVTGTGVPGYVWSVATGTLPPGLKISSAGLITGVVTGPPGVFPITVQVIDGYGRPAISTFTWTVFAAPTITAPANQVTTVGATVNIAVGSTCANTPCTYSAIGLPAGLSMVGATISGTPTTLGTSTSTATIRDNSGITATTAPFTWTVRAAPTISTPANQSTTVGVTVNVPVTSTCPNTPCTYTMNNPPAGLSVNAGTGAIIGTATSTGATPSTITVRDAAGVTATSGTFTWTTYAAPTITTPPNQTTTVGAAVNVTVASTCPNATCTYTLNNPPAGLTMTGATITGTPTTSGPVTSTVTVSDNAGVTATSGTFSWTVFAAPTITAPANQTTTVGVTVNVPFGSSCPNMSCTYSTSGLPAGLSLNAGSITGTPTATGTTTSTITVRDAAGVTVTSSPFTWTVKAAPTLTSPGNQTTTVGAVVNVNLVSTCDNAPCTYSAAALPAGLSLNPGTGAITGTPTTVGVTNVTMTIRDAAGATATATFTWTVYAAPTITTPANQIATVGVAVNLAVVASCTNTPCTYSVTALPAGLTINAATGAVTGSPTTIGTTSSIITVRDSSGITASTSAFTWTVKAPSTITSPGNQATTAGVAVSLTVPSVCNYGPCTYVINGQPAGLSVSSSGVITGTPSTPGISSAVTVTITDGAGTSATTAPFSWTIYSRPTVTSPGNQTSTVNTALILPISTTCSNSPCSYTLSGAPTGLTISSSTGRITGTPTVIGTSASVQVTVTDKGGAVVTSATFSWTITAGPSVTSPGNQSTVNNAAVNLALTRSCPNAPCAYALNGGPAGLSISSAGVITGTVTSAAQTFTGVTITVTDSSGVTATSAAFTWAVTTPLAGRWTFDEASGVTAADSSGNNRPLTLYSGVGTVGRTTTAAQGANALALNGANQSAATTISVLNTSTSFTVSAWVKLSSLLTTQTFVSQDGSQVSAFALQYRAGTTGKFAFTRVASDSTSAGTVFAPSIAAPTIGQWYQLTGAYDSVANTLTLYVNGVQQGSPVAYSSGWNGTGTFIVGRGKFGTIVNGGGTDFVTGAVDDVRAYSSALSDDAVAQVSQDGYWRLNEGSGTTVQDSSLYNATGTLNNGVSWTTGVSGAAAQFDGASGAITTTSTSLDTSQSFSVVAWAKADTATASGTVASVDGTNVGGFSLGQAGGKWTLTRLASDTTGATATSVSATSNITAGQWYRLAAVYDSVGKTLTLYVNGVAQGSPVSFTTGFKATGSFVIGRARSGGSAAGWFGGAIDDVQAFQFPLDQAGVTALTPLVPPVPAAPTAVASAASVTVSWAAPANVAGSPITGYVVTPYLDGVAQTPVTYNSTATTQTVTNLGTGSSYTFSVAAENANGLSGTSAVSGSVLVS